MALAEMTKKVVEQMMTVSFVFLPANESLAFARTKDEV
jgi:hypothetical protein